MTRDVLERTNQIMSEPIVKINSDYISPVHLPENISRRRLKANAMGLAFRRAPCFVSVGLFLDRCFLPVFCHARLSQSPVAGWLISASARRMAGKIRIQTGC